MPMGNDLHHESMSLDEAHEWCAKHDECMGFTYQSPDQTPLGKVHVWFKSTDKVAPGAGWHSRIKVGGAASSRSDTPAGGKLSLASVFSPSPKLPMPGSGKPPVAAGLALLTRKPLHFEWWLHYHIRLGICHFFIHIEDTPELLPFLQAEPYRSLVTVTQKGDSGPFKDNYWTLQDRQRAHVNHSLARCRDFGIEWLFHVDDDELIWLDRPFREIVASAPRGSTNLTFSNLEAIPTSVEPGNYFQQIRTFTKKRMLAYVNGKPAGRTLSSVKLDGPHRFSGPSYAVPVHEGVILHYESCDFNQWVAKFRNQVDCGAERKQAIPFPYYRDSITLFQERSNPAQDMQSWLDFYTKRKINHYNTPEIQAAVRTIDVSSTREMIDLPPGMPEQLVLLRAGMSSTLLQAGPAPAPAQDSPKAAPSSTTSAPQQ